MECLDLLTLDRSGRLVVLELKAGEDLHLPLQALDYWIRGARAERGPSGRSTRRPRRDPHSSAAATLPAPKFRRLRRGLVLAAPALRIHPANETVLRYLSPEIEWELIALAEQWRRELKIVFRKRSAHGQK